MRTLAEMLTDRAIAMRRDRLYRHRLAMRDKPSYDNDPDLSPESVQAMPRPMNVNKDIELLKGQFNYLQNKVMELRAIKKRQEGIY